MGTIVLISLGACAIVSILVTLAIAPRKKKRLIDPDYGLSASEAFNRMFRVAVSGAAGFFTFWIVSFVLWLTMPGLREQPSRSESQPASMSQGSDNDVHSSIVRPGEKPYYDPKRGKWYVIRKAEGK